MNKKNIIIYIFVFLLSFSFLTVGFASYTAELSIEDVGVTVRQSMDVRITNLVLDNASSGVNIENLDYNLKNVIGDLYLPEGGQVTFNVEFTNYVNYPVYLMEIINLPDNLKYEIDVYKEEKYVLENLFIKNNNELKEIAVTISYKDNGYNPENQFYSLDFGFYFESSYTVLFHNNYLPSEYQQVEYIESNGMEEIDTGVLSGNNDLKFELQYSMVKFNADLNYNGIFGTYLSEEHNATRIIYRILGEDKANSYAYLNSSAGNSVLIDTTYRTIGVVYTEKLERIGNTTYYSSNAFEGVKEMIDVVSGSDYSSNIAIFNQGLNSTIRSYMRLYYFKIYDGVNIIRNFIPCYRKSDGEIGLYDIVTKEFFTNVSDSGAFKKGNDVSIMESQNVLTGRNVPLDKNDYIFNSHVFTGWNTEMDGSGRHYNDEQEIYNLAYNNEYVNLYAQWRPYQSEVVFYANGGMGTMKSFITLYGGKQNLIKNTFIKNGYRFEGWNTKADGSGDFYLDEGLVNLDASSGDTTLYLYAQWSRTLLPTEYNEIEYIESTGTQYIDTKVTSGNNNLKFEIKYSMSKLPASGSYVGVFGAYTSEQANTTRIIYGGSSALVYFNSTAGTGALKDGVTRKVNVIYSETLERVGNTTRYTSSAFDGVKEKSDVPNGKPYSGNIVIFNHAANTKIFSSMKLYYFKIYESGELIRNFIPCYRISDNKVGLYDIITKEFYDNKGTGAFIKGDN